MPNQSCCQESSDSNFNNWLNLGLLLALFTIGYLIIRQTNAFSLLAKLNEPRIGYGLIFLIGLLAGFHCVAMCGGWVVAYSAGRPQKNIHWQYNLGRLISYSAIGGLLGGLGSFFSINPNFQGIILILASQFMVLMGLSLFTDFKILKKIRVRIPLRKKPRTPLLIGLANGLMPCGPLQAMQLYALASGDWRVGALSLGLYALGTMPLMLGLGYFISLAGRQKTKQFMRISGIIVIIMGLIMLNRGLSNFGYNSSVSPVSQTENQQIINMDLTYQGYQPNTLYVKKGIPVRWIINAQQISGCTKEIIMPDYNIKKTLIQGENIIEFTPTESGEIKFSCGMQMVWGKFIVQ